MTINQDFMNFYNGHKKFKFEFNGHFQTNSPNPSSDLEHLSVSNEFYQGGLNLIDSKTTD